MKRLLVMRHAKSDWTTAASDHSRPLNPRGIG
jgi:phosphohistidine phosphatase